MGSGSIRSLTASTGYTYWDIERQQWCYMRDGRPEKAFWDIERQQWSWIKEENLKYLDDKLFEV